MMPHCRRLSKLTIQTDGLESSQTELTCMTVCAEIQSDTTSENTNAISIKLWYLKYLFQQNISNFKSPHWDVYNTLTCQWYRPCSTPSENSRWPLENDYQAWKEKFEQSSTHSCKFLKVWHWQSYLTHIYF